MSTDNRVYLFGSQIREKIFSLFFLNTEKAYYLREIAKRIGASAGAVQRELGNLQQLGILVREDLGNSSFYTINKKHALYPELKSITEKQGRWLQELRQTIISFGEKITTAFVYGSCAKGTETPESDVDLFIIGEIHSMKLTKLLAPIEASIGREINPYLIGPAEFSSKHAAKNHFICSIIKEPKLFITGGNGEIQKLIEQ